MLDPLLVTATLRLTMGASVQARTLHQDGARCGRRQLITDGAHAVVASTMFGGCVPVVARRRSNAARLGSEGSKVPSEKKRRVGEKGDSQGPVAPVGR